MCLYIYIYMSLSVAFPLSSLSLSPSLSLFLSFVFLTLFHALCSKPSLILSLSLTLSRSVLLSFSTWRRAEEAMASLNKISFESSVLHARQLIKTNVALGNKKLTTSSHPIGNHFGWMDVPDKRIGNFPAVQVQRFSEVL